MTPVRRGVDATDGGVSAIQGEADQPVRTGWRRLLVEPARPARIASRPNAYWYAVITVCFGAFMGQLDASIVTLAFPTMEKDFHVTVGAVRCSGWAWPTCSCW